MKNLNSFKQLFTLLALVMISTQAWGLGWGKIQVFSSPVAGGYVYANSQNENNVGTLTSDEATSDYVALGSSTTMYRFAKAAAGYAFVGWADSDGGTPTSTSSSVSISVSYKTPTTKFYAIFVPTYTFVFHGNGNTGGSMANQTFNYGTAQNLRANAFERKFTVSYDANGGDCAEASAVAISAFAGWAKSANGAVVYSNGQNLNNVSNTPGAVYDLYAKWNAGTVTLPAPTKAGFLFDGWYAGDKYIGKAGDIYTPTEDVALTAHWASKYTPQFVLDKEEIELEQVAILTMTNVSNPSVVITPTGIVHYKASTGELTGLKTGTVTISITQQETETLSYSHVELTLTVIKKNPGLVVKLGGVEQNIITIFQGKSTTVAFDEVSDAAVEVTTVSGGKSASYSNGKITAGEIGTAVFRATLPETNTYQSASVDFSVKVERDPIHLPMTMSSLVWNHGEMKVQTEGTTSWSNDNGIVLGDVDGGGFNKDDKYVVLHFEGIPDKLTFEIATPTSVGAGIGSLVGGVTNVEWYIKESATSTMPNSSIWTSSYDGTSFNAYTVQLQPSTRYVLLCYSGNFGAYFHNVQISELKYVQDPEPAEINFGAATINTGEVSKTANINWCNVAPLTVESSNPRFTVSPSVFGNYDQMGSQELTISFNHNNEVGPQEADITISNSNFNKTIHVNAETTKRQQTITWNAELAATGFAMNVGEIYPDATISAIATAPSGELITYTSSDPEIIEVIFDTILVAKAVGTAEITAYQAGDAEYEEASDTQTFTVSELLKQTITWDQNLYGLLTTDDAVELIAEASSGGEITYESADESVVRIEGNTLIIVGEGETTVTAYQEGGEIDEQEYLPATATNYVIVRNPASQCNGMALTVNSLTLNSGTLSKEYTLAGTPTSLTFSAKHGTKENGAWGQGPTYAALMVDQYAKIDGVWGWYNIYNAVVNTDATASGTLNLNATATKVRFRTTETGTDHTISDIRIPRAKVLKTDVTAIDEAAERNAIWSKKITITHSNIDLMTVSTQEGLFTVSTATLGEGCGDYGDDEFTVSFTPKEKDAEYSDVIIITDGKAQPSTIEIPVRIYTTSLNQSIVGFELPETASTTDVISVSATASSGLPVVFSSSDEEVAYVENGKLVILTSGTVDITAYQEGNDRYNEASVTKTIVISKAPVQITTAPVASDLIVGQSLSESTLSNGVATVPGKFEWQSPETVPTLGKSSHVVVFTPTNEAIYSTTTRTVEVNVIKLTQEIEWNEPIFSVTVEETLELHARSTAGLEITYTSSDEEIAYMEGNVLHAVSAGTVTITASQAGSANCEAAESVEREIEIVDIVRITPELSQLPEASELTYGQALYEAELMQGVAINPNTEDEVAGDFSWADETQVFAAGTQEVNMVFIPEDLTHYNVLYFTIEVVVNKAEQEIEWVTAVDTLLVGEFVEIEISATSGLTVTLVSDNEDIVLAQEHTLYAIAAGEAIVTAKQEGDNNYLAAEQVSKVVIVRADDATGIGDIQGDNVPYTKILRNGQVFVRRGDTIYTITGMKVE